MEARDKNGSTPMHIAAYHDNVTMVEKLILEGADRLATNRCVIEGLGGERREERGRGGKSRWMSGASGKGGEMSVAGGKAARHGYPCYTHPPAHLDYTQTHVYTTPQTFPAHSPAVVC